MNRVSESSSMQNSDVMALRSPASRLGESEKPLKVGKAGNGTRYNVSSQGNDLTHNKLQTHNNQVEEVEAVKCSDWLAFILGIMFPDMSSLLWVCYPLKAYPDLINLKLLMVVDLESAVAMCLACFVDILMITVFDEDTIGDIVTVAISSMFIGTTVLSKVHQVFGFPEWRSHRRIARYIHGDTFIPIDSNARRIQQAIFSCESLICFSPLMYLIFVMGAGIRRRHIDFFIISLEGFLAIFYSTMALFAFCPAWSLVGWFIKRGFLPLPNPTVERKYIESMSWKGYFSCADKSKCILTHLRYGALGPLLNLHEQKSDAQATNSPTDKHHPIKLNVSDGKCVQPNVKKPDL